MLYRLKKEDGWKEDNKEKKTFQFRRISRQESVSFTSGKNLLEQDKIDRQKAVVLHVPAMAVPAGNPAGLNEIEDLAGAGVRVVLGGPQANPIGKLSDKALKDLAWVEELYKNCPCCFAEMLHQSGSNFGLLILSPAKRRWLYGRNADLSRCRGLSSYR
jgi:ABC-type molybdate transport system substrate-binding protein